MFPTVPPFSEWVDWGASSHISKLILEGTFQPPEVDSLARDLFTTNEKTRFTQPDTGQSERHGVDWQNLCAWPESMMTSPSGFHLTHSKALVAKHDLAPGSPEYATLEEQREQLIQWQVDLLNAAIKNQYSFHQWHSIVNVMILKQPGNHKIHCLRVIHLYEHDYNLLLAVKWRSLVQHCIHTRKFNP